MQTKVKKETAPRTSQAGAVGTMNGIVRSLLLTGIVLTGFIFMMMIFGWWNGLLGGIHYLFFGWMGVPLDTFAGFVYAFMVLLITVMWFFVRMTRPINFD